jgi:hypothetical protein|tara:strand:+ start:268 stop:471 length:204 start_codon:yes stop_codon:yes gene_type:complete
MNERIKELMFESGLGYMSSAHPILVEKFAELIVGECAKLNFRGTGFVTSEGEDMVRSMIKQHFGVEE